MLVEYGDMNLDLALRARAHALHQRLEAEKPAGLLDLTPGIRSLQVRVDPDVLPVGKLMGMLAEAEDTLPAANELVVPSRTVRMPLSWTTRQRAKRSSGTCTGFAPTRRGARGTSSSSAG